MRATKKQAKKNIAVFFRNVFVIYQNLKKKFKNRQQFNARLGRKNTMFFFGNARPKFNARAHLKQRKKHSGPIMLILKKNKLMDFHDFRPHLCTCIYYLSMII